MWLLAIILDSTVLDLFCLPIHNMVVFCLLVCIHHKWSHTVCVGLQLFFFNSVVYLGELSVLLHKDLAHCTYFLIPNFIGNLLF